jgi:hypothetical protein
MSSFISDQNRHAEQLQFVKDDDDPYKPTSCSMDIIPGTNQLITSPDHLIRNRTSLEPAMSSTPLPLQHAISKAHPSKFPKKSFFCQHSIDLQSLPSSVFTPFGKTVFHCDSGANCWGMNSKDAFYFYIAHETPITQVSGTSFSSPEWGGILVSINNTVYGMYPVHHCPNNPKNTCSPSAIKKFSGFRNSIINVNDSLQLMDMHQRSFTLPLTTHNDMDYIDIQLLSFRQPSHTTSINATEAPRRSPWLLAQQLQSNQPQSSPSESPVPTPLTTNSKSLSPHSPSTTNTDSIIDVSLSTQTSKTILNQEYIFPRNVMINIAAWYVQLHAVNSPREVAIRTMNTLLHHPIRNLSSPSQPIHLPGSSQLNHHSSKRQSSTPSISALSQPNVNHLSPVQEYIYLHLATMHSSKSTLEPLLKGQLLQDLPPSLVKDINHFDCTCFICALRKSDKVPRGKLVDKSLLAPFQRIHVDFSFFLLRQLGVSLHLWILDAELLPFLLHSHQRERIHHLIS